MTVFKPDRPARVLLANLTAMEQPIQVVACRDTAKLRRMDASNVEQAMAEPEGFQVDRGERLQMHQGWFEVTLQPHALAKIDLL